MPIENQNSKIENPPAADIRLLESPLDPAAAIASVITPEAGGINLFIGTTRAQSHPDHGPLTHLEYHAYTEMALSHMRRLGQAALSQWPVARLVIWHRLGKVALGEPSVIIAVACPHREEAFAACRFLIDELKKNIPIWKKEIFAHTDRWQGEP